MTKVLKDGFLDLFFPRTCIGCQRKDSWLCSFCFQLIVLNKTQHCYKCGRASLHGATCSKHLNKRPLKTLDGLLIAAHYNRNPLLKKAIRTIKYGRRTSGIIKNLGSLLRRTVTPFFKSTNHPFVIVPVPLHPSRLKQRGFNQAKLLAQALDLPIKPLLKRIKNTDHQTLTTSKSERQHNLHKAFLLTEEPLTQQHIILIDDVSSTGTTLEECCTVLKQQGAKQVWGLVLARND